MGRDRIVLRNSREERDAGLLAGELEGDVLDRFDGAGGDDHVELLAAAGREHCLDHVAFGRVDRRADAEIAHVAEAFGGDVGDEHGLAAFCFERSGVHQADGAGSEDDRAVAGLRVHVFLPVEHARERLDERGLIDDRGLRGISMMLP